MLDCHRCRRRGFKIHIKSYGLLISTLLFQITNLTSETVLEDVRTQILGIRPTKTWQAYSFQDHPGLLLIRNPFTSLGQRYWIRKCLEEYPRKPNKLNIDNEILLEDWWRACHEDGECNKVLLKKLRWTTFGYHHNWDTKVKC